MISILPVVSGGGRGRNIGFYHDCYKLQGARLSEGGGVSFVFGLFKWACGFFPLCAHKLPELQIVCIKKIWKKKNE